jgi:hypothetical protein
MLEPLLGSTNAERSLLFVSARTEGYASEIAKYYDTDLYGIQKQLDKLNRARPCERQVGRSRLYSLSPRYAFLPELKRCWTRH